MIFRNLRKPVYLLITLGVAMLVFDVNYYIMSTLIGVRDLMCVVGAGLTTTNVIFSVILSIMTGIAVSGLIAAYKMRQSKILASSASGVGIFLGMMTVFCPLCTLPIISIFGLSLLPLFSTYEIWFKVVSILLLGISIYILNNQLKDECKICK